MGLTVVINNIFVLLYFSFYETRIEIYMYILTGNLVISVATHNIHVHKGVGIRKSL